MILPMKTYESLGDLLGDQGTIGTGAVVDDDRDLLFPFDRLTNLMGRILNHLRVQHPFHHYVKGKGLFIRILIAHPERGYQPDNLLSS